MLSINGSDIEVIAESMKPQLEIQLQKYGVIESCSRIPFHIAISSAFSLIVSVRYELTIVS